jgi:hypothetical protein
MTNHRREDLTKSSMSIRAYVTDTLVVDYCSVQMPQGNDYHKRALIVYLQFLT